MTPRHRRPPQAPLADGVVAVVTGGASGLGRAICLRLAEEGARAVVVADVRADPREGGDPTTALVSERGAQSRFVCCDVTKPPDIVAAVAAAEDLGGLTLMVNNAGILRAEDFCLVTEADYDALMDVNVKGTFFGAQSAAKAMIAAGRSGSIVNMSSVAGLLGSASLPTYNTSKGAVRLLTYSLAASLGPLGIRVNAVHPGVVETEMSITDVPLATPESALDVPLRRNGSPVDVADAVVYLASPLASYVNGASLVVDGGSSITKARRDFAPNSSPADSEGKP